jgi:hypothetical protein
MYKLSVLVRVSGTDSSTQLLVGHLQGSGMHCLLHTELLV